MDIVDCYHESWECTTYAVGGTPIHECTNCSYSWMANSPYGLIEQSEKCNICGYGPVSKVSTEYVTKDSGKREEFDSGMVRDTQDGKPRYDLLIPQGVPFRYQFLTRVAELLARGAEKYSDRNWERASGREELDRFKSSAFRHFMQWMTDETDEDHAAAIVYNVLAYETTKWKMQNPET